MTMSCSLLFWAKLGNDTWPVIFHPVVCHLIDVAVVTLNLWESAFRPRFRKWVAGRLGLDEDACARWLAFWSGAHDIGKVAACFQDRGDQRTNALKERLQAAGFAFHGWDRHHGTIGTAVLAELLATSSDWPRVEPRLATRVAIAVGGHHGLFPLDWGDVAGLLRSTALPCRWDAARREILRTLARLLRTGERGPRLAEPDDQSVFMVLAGLTSVADWIGSNQQFFPPAGSPAVANNGLDLDTYYQHASSQAQEALRTLGWLGREGSAATRTFDDLFAGILPGEPRPLQRNVEAIARQMTSPSLLLIEAPMGEGKTEAAWYMADTWDQAGGQGVYLALPTMATSNQMFDRVAEFLKANAGKQNLMLQHGKAALNKQFEKLKYAARLYDDEYHPSAVVAEEWFAANKKHGLLAPYGVGTIDQALLAVLQTKHVFVRLFGLAGKCVILDEVHAYDAYMTTLMERLLRWLATLGCPVVLLSATLPREKRLQLLRAYAGQHLPEPDTVPYPRVTTVTINGEAEARHIEPDPSRARTIRLDWLDEGHLVETLRQALANGGCAVVIRNTIGLAQETYLRLRDALQGDGIAIELFHARFPFGRRMEIENTVLRRFGKTSGPAERDKRVLVATQVVEQSLDLDFDVMVSDVAPVDLVLQRAGRLHRHARGSRPARVSEPRLWLINPSSKDGLPDFGASEWVYARYVLLRSYLVVKAVEGVRLPDDLERFVEQVYGTEPLTIPDGWQTALDKSKRELSEEQRSQRMKAKGVLVYRPDDEDLLQQPNAQLDEDNPQAAETIRAATRDTEPTVQVVLVYHIDGRDSLDASGREAFDEADEPDLGRIRRLLDNEVTINNRGCVAFYAGRPVPTGWRKHGLLRNHRIVRLDAFGASLSTEYRLRFDRDIGVQFTRDAGEGAS
jgi:CRISPR-associated endonuclease/helicase Cas3